MENVPAVAAKKNVANFRKWIGTLSGLGYTSGYRMLNAKDFGVPQNRNRCFMVSHLNGAVPDFPQGLPLEKRLKDVLEENVPARYYLSQKALDGLVFHKKMQEAKGNGFGFSPVTEGGIAHTITTGEGFRSNSTYLECMAPGCMEVASLNRAGCYDCVNRVYSPYGCRPTITTCLGGGCQPKVLVVADTSFGSDRAVDAGGLSDPICVKHVPKICTGTAAGKVGVIMQDGEAISVRRLTPRECWRLMGFPDDAFDRASGIRKVPGITIQNNGKMRPWTGCSEAQLYKQAGNSIVVPVLENIFRKMFADRRKRDIQSWSE